MHKYLWLDRNYMMTSDKIQLSIAFLFTFRRDCFLFKVSNYRELEAKFPSKKIPCNKSFFFLTCLWLWSLRRIKALFWFDSKAYQNVKFNKGSSFLESRIFFKFFDMLLICVIISGGSQIWCFEWFLEKGALFCP